MQGFFLPQIKEIKRIWEILWFSFTEKNDSSLIIHEFVI